VLALEANFRYLCILQSATGVQYPQSLKSHTTVLASTNLVGVDLSCLHTFDTL
jgi:hypothetical protein